MAKTAELAVVALVVLELLHLVAQPVALMSEAWHRSLSVATSRAAAVLSRMRSSACSLISVSCFAISASRLGVHALAPLVLPRAGPA